MRAETVGAERSSGANAIFSSVTVELVSSWALSLPSISISVLYYSLSIGVTLDVVRRYGSRRDDTRISWRHSQQLKLPAPFDHAWVCCIGTDYACITLSLSV